MTSINRGVFSFSGASSAAFVVALVAATGNCEPGEYSATQYAMKGTDDDCKYDVSWTSTDVCEGGDSGVYFTVTASTRTDGKPLTGANPYIEAVQSCLYPAPNPKSPAKTETTDLGNGSYKIGPIVFNRPGDWVVRFHFYGDCGDTETSPHGHAAFFVTVP